MVLLWLICVPLVFCFCFRRVSRVIYWQLMRHVFLLFKSQGACITMGWKPPSSRTSGSSFAPHMVVPGFIMITKKSSWMSSYLLGSPWNLPSTCNGNGTPPSSSTMLLAMRLGHLKPLASLTKIYSFMSPTTPPSFYSWSLCPKCRTSRVNREGTECPPRHRTKAAILLTENLKILKALTGFPINIC